MHHREAPKPMPPDKLVELPDRAPVPVVGDHDEVPRGLHDVRGRLALVAEVARGQPRVLAHRDPDGVDPVLPKRVCDPLRDHDGDHDRQDVRERTGELKAETTLGRIGRKVGDCLVARERTSKRITTIETVVGSIVVTMSAFT